MVTMVYYFLRALGADALIHSLDLNAATLVRGRDNVVLHAGNEMFVFAKEHIGYSVAYNNNKILFKKTWQDVQQECIHADCAHRQAEEDLDCPGGEEDYKEACNRLNGCRIAFDLITGQINGNYWYAPEKSSV